MMKKWIVTGLVSALLSGSSAYANKAIGTIVTLLTGAVAAKSFGEGTEMKALEKQVDKLAKQIRHTNPSLQNPAVYSVYFSVDHGFFSESRWADVNASGADLFVKISIEDAGAFIIPEIIYDNRGQNILLMAVMEEIPANSKVVVTLYDDDSKGDKVWNSILQSRKTVKTGLSMGDAYMSIQVSEKGSIKILNTDIVIDSPDYIASVAFKTPTTDEAWNADGTIRDKFIRNVGKLQFAECLSSHDLTITRAKYKRKKVIWFTLGGIFLAASIKHPPKFRNVMGS